MKDLVCVMRNNAVVSSKDVAEHFHKTHAHLVESIRNLVSQNSETKTMFFESSYEYRGQKFPMFWMNRDGFSLLVMGMNGKKALEWKLKYIRAFNEMERRLKEKQTLEYKEAREQGKLIRRSFTDNIKRFVTLAEEQGHKGTARFAYSNFSKLVKKPFGNRDDAGVEQLTFIAATEHILDNTLSPLVDAGEDAKKIYGVCKEKAQAVTKVMISV